MPKLGTRLIVAAVIALLSCGSAHAADVTVTKPYFRWLFGGFGFQHPESNFEAKNPPYNEFNDLRKYSIESDGSIPV